CEQCHGTNYTTGGNLYRNSTGHGGVYCAACHSSPHAWWPSKLWADNMQPTKLQRAPYAIGDCRVCHTKKQTGDSPHVIYYPSTK
ncbi:MAG: cytochrome c3 family protein, partial [Thermodesulfobacteriota bacterium]